MNAVTSFSRINILDAYGPALDAFLPGCPQAQRRKRCAILLTRDKATAARRSACWEADQVLAAIEGIATLHAFATLGPDELDTLHASLIRLMSVATTLQVHGPGARDYA